MCGLGESIAYEAMKKGLEQGRIAEQENTMREAERADAAEKAAAEEKKRAEALEKEVENLKHRLAEAGI